MFQQKHKLDIEIEEIRMLMKKAHKKQILQEEGDTYQHDTVDCTSLHKKN